MNKNFVLKSAASLSKEEMKNVKGGISREEYCAKLQQVAGGSYEQMTLEEWDAWDHAWATHCEN